MTIDGRNLNTESLSNRNLILKYAVHAVICIMVTVAHKTKIVRDSRFLNY